MNHAAFLKSDDLLILFYQNEDGEFQFLLELDIVDYDFNVYRV